MPERILVIKLRHLGDVLLMTPVYRTLARQFSGAGITACVNASTEGVLKNNPDVHDVLPVTRDRGQLSFLREVRRRKFDLVLDFTGTDRSALLTRISGARERWGYHRKKGFFGRNLCYTQTVRRQRDVHVVQAQAAFLREMGINEPSMELRFAVPREADQSLGQTLAKAAEDCRSPKRSAFINALRSGEAFGVRQSSAAFDTAAQGAFFHIHPVSRVMEKCWPAPFMAELIDFVAQRGLAPVITASENEGERAWATDLISRLNTPAIDLSGKLNLQQLGALSRRARLFIGVDSAPMHIAAAVGTPVIGIFGPSSEVLWGPWCERKLVLSRDLPCRLPCKDKDACSHIECLRSFTPAMVLPRVTTFLNAMLNEKAVA